MSKDNNLNNSSFISPLERKGVIDLTKNFIRNTLYDKLKNSNIPEQTKLKICPSNFNIDNQNLYTLFKLEYTLIDDFLIRTQLHYTHSIFNNEIKSLVNSLVPFDDTELMSLLGINLSELNALRFKYNNSNDSSDLIKSTYLYHILNAHTKILKIDEESQTNEVPIYDNALYSSDVRGGPTTSSDIEIRLKNIEEKYNKKLREGSDVLSIENRLNKYKDELEKRYQEELKNEIERFKQHEFSQKRIEDRKNMEAKYNEKYEELQNKFDKKYEELEKMKKELEESKSKLEKQYEERYMELKSRYAEREKNLDYKEKYLEKKYNNDVDISVQRIKFKDELKSLQESIINNEKEIKKINGNNKNYYQEINPVINNEIEYLKKEIEELKNNSRKQYYLKNNYINREEDKKININVKPSKESVLNNLTLLAKNNNSNYINKSKSSNSPSGSGAFNTRGNNKKDIRKRIEELEEEQNRLNIEMREDIKNIINSDIPLLVVDKDEYNQMKNNNIYGIYANNYKPKDIYGDTNINNNYNIREIKEEIKNNYLFDNKIDNKNKNIEINKNEYYNNNYNDNNNNKSKNNVIDNNKYNYNTKKNNNSGLFNNNNNINNNSKRSQNNSIINKSNNNVNKSIKDSTPQNNIGGIGGIGGYYTAGYTFNNNNNNNNLNIQKKNSNTGSDSIIEEILEGEGAKNKKTENSVRKNNFSSHRFQNDAIKEDIKEEIENESVPSNNNSEEKNNNNNNDDNYNDFNNSNDYNNNNNNNNKFNNYDYNQDFDDKNEEEIKEVINYGESAEKRMDIGSGSISGIQKKQLEISESGAKFVNMLGLQSHAGYGANDKESYGDFEFSKGKNNTNNKKGNEKPSKFDQQNSQKISEESNSGF